MWEVIYDETSMYFRDGLISVKIRHNVELELVFMNSINRFCYPDISAVACTKLFGL